MGAYLRDRYPSDIAGMMPLRIVGCYRAGSNVRYGLVRRIAWAVVAAGIVAWQTGIGIGSSDPLHSLLRSTTWSLYFCAAMILVVFALHVTTQRFLNLSTAVSEMLTPQGRSSYDAWYRRCSRRLPQWVSGLGLAVVAIVALGALQFVLGDTGPIEINAPSYVIIALVGFFVGTAAYWTIACIILCILWGRKGMLRLYPLAPANTPGIEALSRLVLYVLFGVVILAIVMLFPTLYATSTLSFSQLPGATAVIATVLQTVLLGLCGLTAVGVGIVPQEALSAAIRRQRHGTMRKLAKSMAENHSADERDRLDQRYLAVAASPTSSLGSGNVVQIVVASATAFAPFVISVVMAHS